MRPYFYNMPSDGSWDTSSLILVEVGHVEFLGNYLAWHQAHTHNFKSKSVMQLYSYEFFFKNAEPIIGRIRQRFNNGHHLMRCLSGHEIGIPRVLFIILKYMSHRSNKMFLGCQIHRSSYWWRYNNEEPS